MLGKHQKNRKTQLSVDFFIPSFSLVIEVDGNQHDKFNSFFHPKRCSYKDVDCINIEIDKQG